MHWGFKWGCAGCGVYQVGDNCWWECRIEILSSGIERHSWQKLGD